MTSSPGVLTCRERHDSQQADQGRCCRLSGHPRSDERPRLAVCCSSVPRTRCRTCSGRLWEPPLSTTHWGYRRRRGRLPLSPAAALRLRRRPAPPWPTVHCSERPADPAPACSWDRLVSILSQPLKVVCHLPTNSHDIFPRIGSHCFHLWTQPKCCLNLK